MVLNHPFRATRTLAHTRHRSTDSDGQTDSMTTTTHDSLGDPTHTRERKQHTFSLNNRWVKCDQGKEEYKKFTLFSCKYHLTRRKVKTEESSNTLTLKSQLRALSTRTQQHEKPYKYHRQEQQLSTTAVTSSNLTSFFFSPLTYFVHYKTATEGESPVPVSSISCWSKEKLCTHPQLNSTVWLPLTNRLLRRSSFHSPGDI